MMKDGIDLQYHLRTLLLISKVILGSTLIILLLTSCLPIMHSRVMAVFKNCTNDTLYIGVSHYDNIDSIITQLIPCYEMPIDSNLDTAEISLWQERVIKSEDIFYGDQSVCVFKDCYIYPDSTCIIDANYLVNNTDTCFFFLIAWKDAKQYSWDEIRNRKLYHRMIVTRDIEGRYDRNIVVAKK